MMASIQEKTLRQYEKPLRLWWEFCTNKGLSPLRDTSAKWVTDFLVTPEVKKLSRSSLNTYRSAISMLSLNDLGKDAGLSRFFQGISSMKPQKPKYENIWDPGPVIQALGKQYPNKDLSLEELTKKLIMLLALSTAQRVQTLSKISIDNIIKVKEGYNIQVPDRIKTSGLNRPQPLLILEKFKRQPQVCVATTLEDYLEKTSKIRGHAKKLFITIKKPHHEASTETLSRWICDVLKNTGIDICVFTAHSTRHAATSAAARNGVNIESIRRAALWTKKSSAFARFYNRPLADTKSFGLSVIGNNTKR